MKVVKFLRVLPLLVITYASITPSFSQDKDRRNSIKFYSNLNWGWVSHPIFLGVMEQRDDKRFNIDGRVAISFASKKSNFHEVELSHLRFNRLDYVVVLLDPVGSPPQTIDGSVTNDFSMSFRYDYNFGILVKSEKIRGYGFAGMQPAYTYLKYNPLISTTFPQRISNLGATIYIGPKVIFTLSDRLILDVNVPINLLQLDRHRIEIKNPQLPRDQRVNSVFLSEAFPSRIDVRLGIGYTF